MEVKLNTKMKPGYKQTPIGEIPEGWEVMLVKEIFNRMQERIIPE